MIDVGNYYFACDECPISEGVEHRLRAAKEGGYDPQFEYCGCDFLSAAAAKMRMWTNPVKGKRVSAKPAWSTAVQWQSSIEMI